jgi:hypothetical protein
MPIVKIRTNRQVTVRLKGTDIVIRPKRLVDMEDSLSPEEEKLVEAGFEQLKNGEYVAWDELKHELDL